VLAAIEEKGGLLSRGVDVVVVLELRHRQEICPVVLPFASEQPEVLLEFLVYPFRLTICLRVVGGSLSRFNPK
jgi:hypothetical protein